MSLLLGYRGTSDAKEYARTEVQGLDSDGAPLEPVFDIEAIKKRVTAGGRESIYRPGCSNGWQRYPGLAYFDSSDPQEAKHIVSLGEGMPKWATVKSKIAEKAGFKLRALLQGTNPSRSFKDLGVTSVVSICNYFGLNPYSPSQGNHALSLVEYCVKAFEMGANISKVAVAIPDSTPMPIFGRIAARAMQYPDKIDFYTVKAPQTIVEAGALLQEKLAGKADYYSTATLKEMGRWLGKMWLGLQIAEPNPDFDKSDWGFPDVIVYPTGGGTGILGMKLAFDVLEEIGWAKGQRPKLISVQMKSTAPLVEAFDAGQENVVPVQAGGTKAHGLNVPAGVALNLVLRTIRESRGVALAVEEEHMEDALREYYQNNTRLCGPETAACYAALPRLVEEGMISAGDEVVVVDTGDMGNYMSNRDVEDCYGIVI